VERYVVRIYRRDPTDPKKIFGTVECGSGHGRAGFLDSDALVNILALPAGIQAESAEARENSATGKEFGSYSKFVELIREEVDGRDF
jgi:hypothetical protein